MDLSKILTGIGRSFHMSFEALYWIMFEIWRQAQKRYTWSVSNLPVGEKYKTPLSDYSWVHWVSTKSDWDLALHSKTWISSKIQNTDSNLAHTSSPGAQEKRNLHIEPWSLTNKKLWCRKKRNSSKGTRQEDSRAEKWTAVGVDYSLGVKSNWGKDIW